MLKTRHQPTLKKNQKQNVKKNVDKTIKEIDREKLDAKFAKKKKPTLN